MVSKIELNPAQAVTARFIEAIDSLVGMKGDDGKKLTLGRISEMIGMHASNITRMRISNTHSPTAAALSLLCQVFDISGSWLLEGSGPMKKSDANEIDDLKILVSSLNKNVDQIKVRINDLNKRVDQKTRRKKSVKS